MMTLPDLLNVLKTSPGGLRFADVMQVIDDQYQFTETAFTNGEVSNKAGENNGSCKVFSFGQLHDLSEQETLHCFAQFYVDDVLKHPDGADHQNIRQFIQHGWKGISLPIAALK